MDLVFSGGTTNYRHYIYAGNEPVAVYSRTSGSVNTMSYMLEDHQGGVANIASKSGTSDVSESFSAFGTRRNPTSWSGAPTTGDLNTIAGLSRQGYTFQTWLGQSMGLNHMNGRIEDSVTGRFLSPDPHTPNRYNTQSWNRYSYVNNNPLTYVDPTGFDEECDGCVKPTDGSPPPEGKESDGLDEIVVTAQHYSEKDACPQCSSVTVTAQSTKTSSGVKLPSFSEAYSFLNVPRFCINTAKEFAVKVAVTLGARLLPATVAAGLRDLMAVGGLASIPLYEAATTADAENVFFYGDSAFQVPGAVDNLPVNLPGPPGGGVAMGGTVYWTEDYYGQK